MCQILKESNENILSVITRCIDVKLGVYLNCSVGGSEASLFITEIFLKFVLEPSIHLVSIFFFNLGYIHRRKSNFINLIASN